MIQNRTKRIWKNVINETAIKAANFKLMNIGLPNLWFRSYETRGDAASLDSRVPTFRTKVVLSFRKGWKYEKNSSLSLDISNVRQPLPSQTTSHRVRTAPLTLCHEKLGRKEAVGVAMSKFAQLQNPATQFCDVTPRSTIAVSDSWRNFFF